MIIVLVFALSSLYQTSSYDSVKVSLELYNQFLFYTNYRRIELIFFMIPNISD